MKTIWVGSGRFGMWIKCPESPLEATMSKVSTETRLLNGGAHVRTSVASRRRYEITWKGKAAELASIKNLYDGIYGDGPFHFVDPTDMANVLPPHWATPALTRKGAWPSLVRGISPVISNNAYLVDPPDMATYTLAGDPPVFGDRTPKAVVPIPPGATLRLTAWGAITGNAALMVRLYDRTTGAVTTQMLTPTPGGTIADYGGPAPDAASAVYPSNTTYPSPNLYPSGGQNYAGPYYSRAELWVGKTTAATSTITLAGIKAQLGRADPGWYPGQGTNGLQFNGELQRSTYRSWGEGWQSMSTSMVEVGSWT